MLRGISGLGFWAGGCVFLAVIACEETISDPVQIASTASAGTGGGASMVPPPTVSDGGKIVLSIPHTCEGVCCPTDQSCYVTPDNGKDTGGECLATRDNTGQAHIQMRQAWIRTTTPPGNTDSLVYQALAGRSELPRPNCAQPKNTLGNGGYIQVIDFFLGGDDITKHHTTIGYSTYVPAANLNDVLDKGFCFGESDWKGDPKYALPGSQMTPSDDYPKGLLKPMGLADKPWHPGPTNAIRLAEDFKIENDDVRRGLLADLDTDGKYGAQGYSGVFFYDPDTGYAHGYGTLGWTVVYAADGKSTMAIPIREVETKSTFNDPKHPNCAGQFLANAVAPNSSPACSSSDPNKPAWGGGNCGDHICDPSKIESPATIHGYFLISEIEQVYSVDLQKTLCVSYPGTDPNDPKHQKLEVDTEGFYNPGLSSCRSSKWGPTKLDGSGIPKGDWCAATNSPAHDNCHDAWHSESIHVFIGGKIQVPADDSAQPQTCPF